MLVSGRVAHKLVSFLFVSNWEHTGTPQALETNPKFHSFRPKIPAFPGVCSKFSKHTYMRHEMDETNPCKRSTQARWCTWEPGPQKLWNFDRYKYPNPNIPKRLHIPSKDKTLHICKQIRLLFLSQWLRTTTKQTKKLNVHLHASAHSIFFGA